MSAYSRALRMGTVYLAGYSFERRLKADAAMAAKRASGVNEVADKIEVLPASQNDDRIRWATFYRIYTDDVLSRYAPGSESGVLQELRDERQFPGMQPVGPYAIHITSRTAARRCSEPSTAQQTGRSQRYGHER
jgi:hypothetical protein